MLRRLSVRTRLIAVLAVPLVLLLAIAVPELIERRAAAGEADRAADLATAASDVAATVDALQAERTASAPLRAGAGEDAAVAVRDRRVLTDTTIEPTQLALARIASLAPELTDTATTVSDLLRSLDDVRRETDISESIVPWVDPYAELLAALLDLQEDVGAAVAGAGVGTGLTEVALLARAKDATANQAVELAAAAVWGELRGSQVRTLTALRADEQAFRTAYLVTAPADERVARREAVAAGAATSAGRVVDAVIREQGIGALEDLDAWLELAAERQIVLRGVEVAHAARALDAVLDAGADARRASTAYLALSAVGLALALGLALLAARSITRPLRRLTDAADHLAEERLPKLVDALRHPSDEDERYLTASIQPIEVSWDDELGHLATAFNAVQSVAVEVAAEQAQLLRKGISDLYVNLARRNQALIERQIQLLDRLEGGEQDPDVLEHLYLLDHLATRMRRNAESLLILAGVESGPRRSRPVPAVDLVRAALSEVEDYHRVEIGPLAEATVHGPAVTDVAHILAELIENATHFSPPESVVRVDGGRSGGSYQLVVTDQGVGVEPGQLDELNALLEQPPVTGLALGRSLGCLVAGRLAARHGITVRLRPGEDRGVVAHVVLPRHLLVDELVPEAPQPAPAPPLATGTAAEVSVVEDARSPDPWLADWDGPTRPPAAPEPAGAVAAAAAAGPDGPPGEPPERLRDAIPTTARFEAGLLELLQGATSPRRAGPVAPSRSPRGDAPRDPDRAAAAGGATPAPGGSAELARRSPDEVRALLTRYRSGLQAGRGRGGPPEEDRR